VHQAGLDLRVDGNAWSGQPADLEKVLTPVRVSIVNDSRHPVRIRYDAFKLTTPSGQSMTAIPPFQIQQPGPVQTAVVPVPPWTEFYPAAYLAPYYPGSPTWTEPLAAGPAYDYDVARWRPDLPTASMVTLALPDGVLKPGGRVSGFLFFPKLPDDAGSVTFDASLTEPQQGQQLASVEIPFRVQR
jgi:hypothetical protein